MIGLPHNDHECLGAITAEVAAKVHERDEELVRIAHEHDDIDALVAWIRSLPQRDDEGIPCDGPKVEECRPPQRLRIPAADPNCVERSALFIAAAELIDPTPVRRLATVKTPAGLHTLPTEDGDPVVLDPRQSRNALRAGLFHAENARNAAPAPIAFTPAQAVDWIAKLAVEPAERFVDGPRRVRNGHLAIHRVLIGCPLAVAEVGDVAFTLALAERESRLFGPAGPRIVQTTAHAVDRLDQLAAEDWKRRTAPRDASELMNGGQRTSPNMQLLGSLARIGGSLGGKVGLEVIKLKLAAMGISPPVINSIEQELNREGLSLGPLAKPSPILGSLGALTPEALAGGWLAGKL